MKPFGAFLELRRIEPPRNMVIECLEREFGPQFLYEYRYFLADQPLDNGLVVEIYRNQVWIAGRFEWSGNREELPNLRIGQQPSVIFVEDVLRWPDK
jgi:hypothetical protein